jgi:hypothetical protein
MRAPRSWISRQTSEAAIAGDNAASRHQQEIGGSSMDRNRLAAAWIVLAVGIITTGVCRCQQAFGGGSGLGQRQWREQQGQKLLAGAPGS